MFGDGIYPDWPVLLTAPKNGDPRPGAAKFTQRQESIRKDVERLFGIMKAVWRILRNGLWYKDKEKCIHILRTCAVI